MNLQLAPIIIALVPVATAILVYFGGRFTTKASDVANRRGTEVDALKSANETLLGLLDPIKDELKSMRETNVHLEAARAATDERLALLEESLEETQEVLSDSLLLNLAFQVWFESGAEPPPPTATTKRLQRRLEELREQSHTQYTGHG